MTTTSSETDLSIGLGILFSILAIAAAAATLLFGYSYAIQHAAGEAARGLQITSGLAFGVAMLAASLAIVGIHLYDV